MYKGEFNFNLGDVTKCSHLPMYGDGYYASNEPLHNEISLMPPAGKRVLTVAASGDQPLLYAAHGASHIDTFDLTVCARAIMDFKTTALQTMTMGEYRKTVATMYNLNAAAMENAKFSETIARMPADTKPLMETLSEKRISAFCRDIISSISVPRDPMEYQAMQQKVTRPFNFIWANLMHLHNYLETDYDIINLSNIFDHYAMDEYEEEIVQTLLTLLPYVRPGGAILSSTFGYYRHNAIMEIVSKYGTHIETVQHDRSPIITSVIRKHGR